MTEDELILTHILQCTRSEFYLRNPQLTENQKKQFEFYKERRRRGEPLQYILGVCDFMGLVLKVDHRVLVPRPETEGLVDEAINKISNIKTLLRILDLGTGSGNIAIAIAKFIPKAIVTTVDVSSNALDVAKDNARVHGIEDRINFVCADMVEYLYVQTKCCPIFTYDLIISNPPYIPTEQMGFLPIDVKKEPSLALEAGSDGLSFYRDIIKYTPPLLREDGYLMMEFGDGQAFALKNLILEQKSFSNIEIFKDLAGIDRIICSQKI